MPDLFDEIAPAQTSTKKDLFDEIAPDTPKQKGSGFHAPDLMKLVPSELGGKGGTIQEAGRQVREGLPMIGGIAGSALAGPMGGMAGAGAGSFAKQALSENPDIGSGLYDTIIQGVIPEAIGSLGSLFKGIKNSGIYGTLAQKVATTGVPFTGKTIGEILPATKIAQSINKAKGMLRPESQMVETAAANTQSNLSPAQQSLAKGTVAEDLSQIPYTQQQIQQMPPLGKTADKIFSDISEVRNAKMATGNPTIVRQLAQDRLIRGSFDFAKDTFKPGEVLNNLGKNEDIYREALGSGYDTFKNFVDEANKLGVGKDADNLFGWKSRGKIYLGAGVASALLGKEAFAATEGLILGYDAIKKIASDPALGQLVVAAMKAPKSSPVSPILSRAIANGLRGTSLIFQSGDGDQKVRVSEEGQLQLAPPK